MRKNTNIQNHKDILTASIKFTKHLIDSLALDSFIWWRPIVYGVLTYTEASTLPISEILEANSALDIKLQQDDKHLQQLIGNRSNG